MDYLEYSNDEDVFAYFDVQNLSIDHSLSSKEIEQYKDLIFSPNGLRQVYFKDSCDLKTILLIKNLLTISDYIDNFKVEKYVLINLSPEDYKKHAMPFIKSVVESDELNFDVLCEVLQPRTEYFSDIPEKLGFLNERPDIDPALYFSKKFKTDATTAKPALEQTLPVLEQLDDFSVDSIHEALFSLIEKLGVKNGWILGPLRVAIAGVPVTPGGAVELCAVLGKEETLSRLRSALASL